MGPPRARAIAFLIVAKSYPANRLKTEVTVPRRTPSDQADIVVYEDDRCQVPYLVVENKADDQSAAGRKQGIEQMFGNANSLRAPLGLYDEGGEHVFFDVKNFPATERKANRRGGRNSIPEQYGRAPVYTYIAGAATDIQSVQASVLEAKIRRSHSIIWAGGKRDPLYAFDEWSKLLFAKVVDERNTPTGEPRGFQIGTDWPNSIPSSTRSAPICALRSSTPPTRSTCPPAVPSWRRRWPCSTMACGSRWPTVCR